MTSEDEPYPGGAPRAGGNPIKRRTQLLVVEPGRLLGALEALAQRVVEPRADHYINGSP